MASLNGIFKYSSVISKYTNIDAENQFPVNFFKFLREHYLLKIALPDSLNVEISSISAQLEILKIIGRKNLSGGRIFEGHLNAIQLLNSFAKPGQRLKWYNDIEQQKLFGVWNSQDTNGVRIIDLGKGTFKLAGSKTFCSGASFIQRPLVTGEWVSPNFSGWQMFVLSPEKIKSIQCDPEFWQPLGMKASVSYRMDFTGIEITTDDLLGEPGDYYQQPLFNGGAIRFAAVQLGGAEAILTEVHRTLKQSGRSNHPFQQARMAEIAYLVETGNLWIAKAGSLADNYLHNSLGSDKLVAYADMTRTVIEEICLKVMQLAERSVGSQAFLHSSPLEQLHRDLTIYLRQPGPDAALTNIGAYIFDQPAVLDLWSIQHE